MTDVMGLAHRSEVVKTRRGYTLTALGLLFPGSAQALHGSRKVGRFALKLWLILVALALLALVLTLVFRNAMIGFFANSVVLRVLAVAIFVVGAFWTILALNTWWIARPRGMGVKKGAIYSVIALVLAVVLATGTAWATRAAWVTGGALGNIFGGGGQTVQNKGRYNILLMGLDTGPDRWGTRPDSVTVASISIATGRTVLFSLPRNLEMVPFPEGTPLHAVYPGGYNCPKEECLLNAVYLAGLEHADLYPGVADPGIQAMLDAATGITGLAMNYYAAVDMQGLIDLIDALGGLTITIQKRLPLNKADGVFLEAGTQHLDGYNTLWFARTRQDGSDYDRMQRQKCVMAAMLQQLNPSDVAARFTALAQASGATLKTSVPTSQIGTLIDLAVKAKALPIVSVSFTPPFIAAGNPDYPLIQTTVANTILQSEALDSPAATAPTTTTATTAAPTDPGTGPAAPDTAQPAGGNVVDNLDQVCSVG
ncbi:MAG: LCP family protein [Propionibacteriaceae bacterium]|jgi:LCP family protein required for cell wall assembly|nr:LCP family protein [Propionibacteriaceae bacterium]